MSIEKELESAKTQLSYCYKTLLPDSINKSYLIGLKQSIPKFISYVYEHGYQMFDESTLNALELLANEYLAYLNEDEKLEN